MHRHHLTASQEKKRTNVLKISQIEKYLVMCRRDLFDFIIFVKYEREKKSLFIFSYSNVEQQNEAIIALTLFMGM